MNKKLTFTPKEKTLFELMYLWFSLPTKERSTGLEAHRQDDRIMTAFESIGTLLYDEAGEPHPGAIQMRPEGGTLSLQEADVAKLKTLVADASTVPGFSRKVIQCLDMLEGATDEVSDTAS